jgi:DNA-binding transcriptional regulator YdaS (Cro superfamily)
MDARHRAIATVGDTPSAPRRVSATVGATPSALRRAIAAVGGTQTALARALGLSQAHVWNWLRAGRVPAERVLAIYRATGGEVTPHALRPDIYPDPEYRPRLETPSGTEAPSAEEAPAEEPRT